MVATAPLELIAGIRKVLNAALNDYGRLANAGLIPQSESLTPDVNTTEC